MGEVYRARDTRLSRDVALKLLPEALAAEPDRVARFRREAQVLASLNHPHIAAIHGLEEADGKLALVLELVPGETLEERMKRGRVPVEEAVGLALQIAAGLEAAHEKGVIHRDLKPANVKIAPDAQVKLLDFGLAKAIEGDPAGDADVSTSPTLSRRMTEAGLILGTAAYMSPEQARGKAVDRRADIWAFGVVLYEMLAGKRLFAGETVSDTLAAVLKTDPDWSALPAETPVGVRRLLRRCLERDPRRRLHDIADARLELEERGEGEHPTTVSAAASPLRARRAVAAALALVTAGGLGWSLRRTPRPETRKLDIADEQLWADDAHRPALSPNGRRVVYFSRGRLRHRDLHLGDPVDLPGTEGAQDVFWSADSREVGFHKDKGLYRLALGEGALQLVAETGAHVGGAGACWAPDGRIVFSRGNTALLEIPTRGGEPRVVLEPDRIAGEDHFHRCSFLPGGRALLFVIHPRGVPANTLALFAEGRRRVLFAPAGETIQDPMWSPSGHILFQRSAGGREAIWALPFSSESLKVTGEPFPVAPGGSLPSVGSDGSLLYAPARSRQPAKLLWVARSGKREGTPIEFSDEVTQFALSRDGKRVAAAVYEGRGADLWVADLDRGSRTRLTFGGSPLGGPAWSPDGSLIAFAQNNQIYVVASEGGTEPRAVGGGLEPEFVPDGRTILAHRLTPGGKYDIVELDVDGKGEPREVLRDSVSLRYPVPSTDGRYLAYDRGEGSDTEAFLTRYPQLTGRWQVSAVGGTFLRWATDGRRLYYFSRSPSDPTDLWLVEVEFRGGETASLGAPRPLFSLAASGVAASEYQVSPSGDRFLMVARQRGEAIPRFVLVQNWFEEFRQR